MGLLQQQGSILVALMCSQGAARCHAGELRSRDISLMEKLSLMMPRLMAMFKEIRRWSSSPRWSSDQGDEQVIYDDPGNQGIGHPAQDDPGSRSDGETTRKVSLLRFRIE